jgi:hypothetical protein
VGVLFANAKCFMGALTYRFLFISRQKIDKVEGVEWKALDRRFVGVLIRRTLGELGFLSQVTANAAKGP